MLNTAHSQRGQTFPIWVFGTLTVLALLGFAMNYGNSLYWQIRAQNAADAVAQGAMSIQATRWNAMTSTLHAAAVEEYRLRYIARDLGEVDNPNAAALTGCTSSGTTSCATIYANLRNAYIQASNRYSNDVQMINALDTQSQANDIASIKTAVANLQSSCATNQGADCAFNYTLVNAQPRTSNIENVISDCCAYTVGGQLPPPSGLNSDLQPLQIEVVACATVKPLFPALMSWVKSPSFTAIGRAAATTMMATQEFMEVGSMQNPLAGGVTAFQPAEFPESTNGQPLFANNDPYLRIDYGDNANHAYGNPGNPAQTQGNYGFVGTLQAEALDTNAGWWTAIPMPPYAGPITTGSFTCK